MPAPKEIHELVERFEREAQAYRSSDDSATRVRREFIEPLFAALGWDIDNREGRPQASRDVVLEASVAAGAVQLAPGHVFCVGGVRKFCVAARKPGVSIDDDPESSFQLRRYAWSAGLSLSIITNFEQFAVYDCRFRPAGTDPAASGRIVVLNHQQYIERWDEVIATFSRASVAQGRFEQYAADTRKKRGPVRVDDSFLGDMEDWREQLASDILGHDAGITEARLNDAVLQIVNRIVFLRMCEARGIAPYKQLIRQVAIPDALAPGVTISPELLTNIARSLYYPVSPYEFSVLDIEILGQIYERFLGKAIAIRGRAAVVESKLEVRRAGGVYYTPTHIVDHLVADTVGRALAGKTPRQAARMRVVDPACGSGTFLLRAFKYLLDWHLAQYQSAPESKDRLTTSEKRRILENNIFGVDIDPQAVAVTRLSLLLMVLECAPDEGTATQLELFSEFDRPGRDSLHVGDNIKCGNSLVESDINAEYVDADASQVYPFDWADEFPGPASPKGLPAGLQGSFDVVIGNPPWGQKGIMDTPLVKEYIRRKYPSSAGIYDLFRPFVERGIDLVKPGGYFGMVLPDIVLLKNYQDTRKLILDQLTLSTIDWWGMAFPQAVIDAATVTGVKRPCPGDHAVRVRIRDAQAPLQHDIPQRDFLDNPRHVFNLYLTPERRAMVQRLAALPALGDYFEVHEGVHSGNMRKQLFVDQAADESCRAMYFGRGEISPYHLSWRGRYVRLSAVPRKGALTAAVSGAASGKKLYANVGRPAWYEHEKLLIRRTGDHVLAALDDDRYYASNNFFIVFVARPCPLNLNGLCALLNSRFITWYFRTVEPRKGRVFAELKIKHISAFPLPRLIDQPGQPGQETQKIGCAALNQLGQERRDLAAEIADAHGEHERDVHERRARALDAKIDEMVHRLYDLSDAEAQLITD